MAFHSLNSLEMPFLASEFSSALLHVICGHTSNVASPTKNPTVIVAADVKKIQTTKKIEVVIWWRKV